MASEYVSTSSAALKTMAKHLTGTSSISCQKSAKQETSTESTSPSSSKSVLANNLEDISKIFTNNVSKIVIMQNVNNVNM